MPFFPAGTEAGSNNRMHKEIVIVGLNHRSAPIEVRESVAFESSYISDALRQLRAFPSIQEGVILSTCNRVEVVAVSSDRSRVFDDIKSFLAQQKPCRKSDNFEAHVYTHCGAEAVHHLFRVASSLDSMIIGEPQILGQLKTYYQIAQNAGTVGAILHRLFHRSFSVAKRVRSETGIANRVVSISSVAVELAKKIFDRFEDKTVMLVGAGKMGDLMARQLKASGVQSLMVTNRTFEHAVELAARIRGNPIRFEDFPLYLKLADLVIGCAAFPELILDATTVERVLKQRKQTPMFFIDIGDRRNFDPKINNIDNAYLYNLDDLKGVAEENLQERAREAEKGEEIVHEEVGRFLAWIDSLEQVPTIAALRQKLDDIRARELQKSLSGGLRDLSEKQREALEDMTVAIINKILHGPISLLKKSPQAEDDEDAVCVAALKKLFDLDGK
jgi:glutamyl-tRNA reductase